jgi:hypothetical protein
MSLLADRPVWQQPVQWPNGATASDARLVVRERLLKAAILFAMLALTVLDRFGLGGKVGVAIVPMYALVGVMVLGGVAALNLRPASAYLALVSVGMLSLLVNAAFGPKPFVSPAAFLLVTVLYAPFCVSLRQGAVAPELWRWTVNLYIAFAVFVGVAGIVQFCVQFVLRPEWLFDYTPLIPEPLRMAGEWNTDYTVNADGTGSNRTFASNDSPGAWTKSNGFFMREPSFFSVVMAFGLVCELCMARRKWVMSVLVLGLVLSYSGSGLLCLAAGLLFPLGRRTMVRVLASVVVAAVLFVFLGDTLNISYTLGRADELSSSNSSAYCRLVAPAVEAVRSIDSNPWTGLVGNGPGSMARILTNSGCVAQATYAKALFEYGLVGTLAFAVLILGAITRSSAPVRIRVATGVTWLLVGGNLADPWCLLFIYTVLVMWPSGTAQRLSEVQRPSFRQAQEASVGASIIHAERLT